MLDSEGGVHDARIYLVTLSDNAMITLFLIYVTCSFLWATLPPESKRFFRELFENGTVAILECVCKSVCFIVSLPERVLAKIKKKDSSSQDQQLGKAIDEWHKRQK